jgi:anthranilate synthase component 1
VRPAPQADLPPFTGGLVGFFAYDFARHLERLPGGPVDDLRIPDAVLGDYDTVLAFDHLRNRLLLMTAVALDGYATARGAALAQGRRRLHAVAVRLDAPLPAAPAAAAKPPPNPAGVPEEAEFLAAVEAARRQIAAGEIFQVVLSRRFSTPWTGSPVAVYRHLRSHNPSPYHFFLACDGDHVVGASPEMLVRVHAGNVSVRPIAGTRPRGQDDAEDRRLEDELRADGKERAEHVMLVDLARNDVGRVCRPGSVRVEDSPGSFTIVSQKSSMVLTTFMN